MPFLLQLLSHLAEQIFDLLDFLRWRSSEHNPHGTKGACAENGAQLHLEHVFHLKRDANRTPAEERIGFVR
jgi:hypothetical protein